MPACRRLLRRVHAQARLLARSRRRLHLENGRVHFPGQPPRPRDRSRSRQERGARSVSKRRCSRCCTPNSPLCWLAPMSVKSPIRLNIWRCSWVAVPRWAAACACAAIGRGPSSKGIEMLVEEADSGWIGRSARPVRRRPYQCRLRYARARGRFTRRTESRNFGLGGTRREARTADSSAMSARVAGLQPEARRCRTDDVSAQPAHR